MSARLVLEISGRAPAELPRKGRMVLGSDPERADLVLDGQGVAGVHCAIGKLKGGGWALKDLGSEFGTLVNNAPVTTARLAAGDVVLLGSRRLKVVDPDAAAAGAPAERAPRSEPAAPVADTPAAPPTPPVPARPAPAEDAPRERARPEIPGFRVDRLLGKGGAGTVWLAEQESLARQVALKVLHPKLARDAAFVKRFQDEARAAAALNHPNVVHVYDVGESGGQHYLVMEYMAGGCLESVLARSGPLPWREALRALTDIARALVFAESRGLVHRDIKPANLMRGEHGTTKLADLGLAAQVEQASLEQTVERKVLGTPHFIAPEVIRGAPASPRSDLFSLGATAYRVLSGRTPFQGERTADILRSVLNDTPEPLDGLVPGLPPGVARFVERLLAKDPDQRPPSASVALAEFERLHEGRAAAPPEGLARPGSRKGLLVLVGLALVAAVAFAVLGGKDDEPTGGGPGGGGPTASGTNPGGPAGGDPGTGEPGGNPDDGTGDPTPTDAPSPGPGGVAGPGDGPAPGGDEAAERAFEERAALALVRLGEEQLEDLERAERLRALAVEFRGSTAAARAVEEANELERAARSEQALEDQLATARQAFLTTAREAAGLGATPPRPGDGLRALAALPERDAWVADDTVQQALADLRTQVLDEGRAHAEAVATRAEELRDAGDADALEALLTGYLAVLDFPAFEAGVPPQVLRMREVGDQARITLAGLDELRTTFARRAAREGRQARADALGGREGLEQELAGLDLDTARARLDAWLAGASVDDVRAPVEALAAELDGARTALAALKDAWDAPGWRRLTVLDPRGNRATPAECVGLDDRGVLVAGSGGPETIPWEAYGRDARCLAHLFLERLERDWTSAERAGIATLVRQAAVLGALELAGQMLETGSTARFSPSEAEDLMRPFDEVRDWSDPGAPADALERERAAARVLVLALRAVSEEHWGDAAVHLERLVAEHEASLIVLLLSDGGA